MVRKGIAIQSEESFVRVPFQLESLRFYISRLHVDSSVMKLEHRDVPVAINGNILRVRRYEWIDHDTVEVALETLWYVA